MGKSKAPAPPDPRVTAGAQTAQNIGTAIAQQSLNNINQVTPYGSLSYEQTGTTQYTDPNNGQVYNIPQYTAEQTLSGSQRRLQRVNDTTQLNLAKLGRQQSNRLGRVLGKSINTRNLPKRGRVGKLGTPDLEETQSSAGLQTGIANAGNVTSGIANAGNVTSGIANAGNVTSGIANAGNVTSGIANAGDITKTYGTDFSQDRQRVEDALLERLNPSLERDQEALEARLASQGIRRGSAAFSDAFEDFGRQRNDARLAAVLGAGQEQSRLAGLEAQRAQFENSAQAQNFGQNAQRSAFANEAQAQRFGQNAQRSAFANEAQAQRFGQNAQRSAFANEAQAQRFGQNAQRSAFANEAQAQRFGQNAAQAQFTNTARQQEFANAAGATQANNSAELQRFNAGLALSGAQDAQRASALQERFATRNQTLNEISALSSGSQVQTPSFLNTQPAQLANTDVAGINFASNQAAQANYQAQVGQQNSLIGGLAGLGSAFILSDRRAKTDIDKLGKTNDGLGIYKYRYKSGGPTQIGLMAQEVEKKKPGAVAEFNGLKMVNYDKALKEAS
ncbi:tail fiber domain-containing protein [Epibacterium ulvae]|uniref:tail fiber domain-containing protein n=1 Tax=Epibacterium ulvae TaxID=1156985 RepID=UPI001BFCA674|nr:tail fiber domain-containing protein [Epibacterium ulvae]MBT8152754.1 tail fiber domain-containing protein [Epibacterium ulvae]